MHAHTCSLPIALKSRTLGTAGVAVGAHTAWQVGEHQLCTRDGVSREHLRGAWIVHQEGRRHQSLHLRHDFSGQAFMRACVQLSCSTRLSVEGERLLAQHMRVADCTRKESARVARCGKALAGESDHL